jgi:para-aminobenzoate synthetase component 1
MMLLTSFEQWKQWSQTYKILPFIYRAKGSGHLPLSWEPFWQAEASHTFLLESGKQGQYTCIGERPVSVIWGKGLNATIQHFDTTAEICQSEGMSVDTEAPPLQAVKQWMQPFKAPIVTGAPKFVGGCVGFWGYDVIRTIEKIPRLAADALDAPDYYFMRFEQIWMVDQEAGDLYCCVHKVINPSAELDVNELQSLYQQAEQEALAMKQRWDERVNRARTDALDWRKQAYAGVDVKDQQTMNVEELDGLHTSFAKERFIQAVEQIQEYIKQGDVFQVNLSVRLSRALQTKPEDIYEWLRVINPSPYMGLLRFPSFQLVSASPELLVKLVEGKVSTRPIAGTRRRGKSEEEDHRMAEELRSSEKEQAEHVMLVDLERNDLGRISKYGTVRVDELMVIEYYSHVMHLVSEVVGELSQGKDALDVIEAAFPGGTITGAPKIRTMEIIEELEPVRRGPYTGSIGWIDYNGNMEFNIVIRTMLAQEGTGHVQAGAGIVIDSIPEREYKESLSKAKALWKAIQLSESFQQKANKEGV